MANSPDISALAAYAGKYEKALFSTLVNSLDAMNDLTVIQDVKNKLNMTKLKAGNGARPYATANEGRSSDLQYTGRVLEVLQGKRDLNIAPNDYRSTWMSEVMKPGVNPKEIPFAAYVWEQVMKELAAEINDNTIYFGFDKTDATAYDGGSTYAVGDYITFTAADGISDYWKCVTITTAGQSPVTHPAKWQKVNAEAITVGFGKRIADDIANIEVESTGAIASGTAYAQYKALYRALPVAYRKMGVVLYSSWDNVDLLVDDYEDKVGKFTTTDNGIMTLPGSDGKCQIVRASWMTGSGRLICTPKSNLLVGTDRTSDLNNMKTDEHLRTVEASIEFVLGTQIRDLNALVVNDVA